MNLSLPEIVRFQQTHQHETAWSDHYGALFAAAQYCQVDLEKNLFPHVWQHGCFGPWSSRPEILVYNTPNAREKKLFVARTEEVELLKNAGYKDTNAIGLPIVYIEKPPLIRTPNTLLIMPQHTLVGLKIGSDDARKKYLNQLEPYIHSFDVVAACINPNCIINNYFVNDLKKMGIEIIPGALTSDINALLRIRCLMEQFDTITTNGWGSHIAYALAFGMKISVFGEHFRIEKNERLKDISFASLEEEKRNSVLQEDLAGEHNFTSQFKCTPAEGIENRKLGEWLIGLDNKKSPEDLKSLFEWN